MLTKTKERLTIQTWLDILYLYKKWLGDCETLSGQFVCSEGTLSLREKRSSTKIFVRKCSQKSSADVFQEPCVANQMAWTAFRNHLIIINNFLLLSLFIYCIYHIYTMMSIYIFKNRDEMCFANLALISSRQMTIHASMIVIFLVAVTENRCRNILHLFINLTWN